MAFLDPGSHLERLTAVRDAFQRHFGHQATAAGWAPGRVNLIGEHTDYNGGLCLPIALPHATYVAVAPRGDHRITIVSEQQSTLWEGDLAGVGPGMVAGWPAYVAGVLWALRTDGYSLPGVDLVVDSTVPVGAGLSSSAALSCATALALTAIAEVELTDELRGRLITACIRAETEVAGAPTGGLDQTVALRAQAGHALLLDLAEDTTTPLRQIDLSFADDDLTVLIVDTRVAHALVDGGFAARRADCEAAAGHLGRSWLSGAELDELSQIPGHRQRRRAHHVLTENQRVLVEGVNRITKHIKAGSSATSASGGIEVVEAPIHVSNVMIVDPEDNKPTRIRTRVETEERDGRTITVRTRVSVRSGKDL